MDTLPIGWTVHTCDPEADVAAGPMNGGVTHTYTSTHVHDLFHEDAQVQCLLWQLKYVPQSG